MDKNRLYSLTLLGLITVCTAINLKGFDDSVLYNIEWFGQQGHTQMQELKENGHEVLTVMGNPLEVYECAMPAEVKKTKDKDEYTGPSPLELVISLFSSSMCSYRIESYWTYEICHGHYIKQYHEEREGKLSKVQEYYLGKWNADKTLSLREQYLITNGSDAAPTKYKKILTMTLPYFEIEMTDGTICDLNNQPRVTKVLYVCYQNGKNEVFSLKETSTCNYEVIILTSTLCAHPKYKPEEMVVNTINCASAYVFTPRKPMSLMGMDLESMKLQYQKMNEITQNLKDIAVVNIKDGTLKMEILPGDQLRSLLNDETEETTAKPTLPTLKLSKTPDDTSPVTAFLEGKHCLTGGTGWWKYEFCYGQYVRQFHIDQNGETSLFLGFFDEKNHKEWLKENESKRPRQPNVRPQLTHFYSGGSICEKTGEKRQTEVKLKCMEKESSPSAVSLYLMEPKTCQYILGVESPLICDIISKADYDGLVPTKKTEEEPTEKQGIYRKVIVIPSSKNDEDGGAPKKTATEKNEEVYLGNAVVEDFEVRFEND